jgi:sterol desaturase/sphingolipid hydroxylase (fatty acid hydroxylase superfamily)
MSDERPRAAARRIAELLATPLCLGLGLGAGWLVLRRGYPEGPSLAAIFVGTAALLHALERWLPHARSWSARDGDEPANLAHLLLSVAGSVALFQALAFTPLRAGGRVLSSWLGASPWPASLPLPLQFVLALLVAELGYYWGHRLSHEIPLLWRVHATHHSVRRLYWLNSGHFHPLDNLLGYALEVSPLLLLGIGREALLLYSVFTSVNGMLKHSNVAMRLGPLNWILSSADLHRWHHAPEPRDGNTNYGANLILWDIVFGTRHLPGARRPPERIGLDGLPGFPRGFLGQLAAPFRWRAIAGRRPTDHGPDSAA